MNISNNDKLLEELNNIDLNIPSPLKTIPKIYAKRQRLVQQPVEKKISYDDILNNMGMYTDVEEEQVYLIPKNNTTTTKNININNNKVEQTNKTTEIINNNINRNSYIYNKYFKNELDKHTDDGIRRPKTIEEYKKMLLDDLLKKRHIQQIKSKQIKIPTSNIGMSDRPSDLNKLFKFSNK